MQKVCNICKSSDFYPSGGCRPCMRAYAKKWNEEHKEQVKKKAKDWREKNKESISKRQKEWKLLHPNYDKEWAANNPESVKKHQKKYVDANRDKKNSAIAKWRYENSDKVKLAKAEWKRNNKELLRVYKQNRRAREKRLTGILTKGIVEKLHVLQQGMCAVCYKPLNGDYHLDHIVPLALNGENSDSNMQLLHSSCNLKKNAVHPVDFMQKNGFLI